MDTTIKTAENVSRNLFAWFEINGISKSVEKCLILISREAEIILDIGPYIIKNDPFQKCLEGLYENHLNSEKRIDHIYNEAS